MSTSTYKGLEQQLFTWTSWDSDLPDAFIYHDCTTKVQIGKYPACSKIFSIYFNISNSSLSLFETEEDHDEDNSVEVQLQLSVKTT